MPPNARNHDLEQGDKVATELKSEREEPASMKTKNSSNMSEEEDKSVSFGDESMKRTMKELVELDEQFQRDCKRQRQRIEKSEILKDEGVDLPKDAFHPVLRKPQKDLLTADDGQEHSLNMNVKKAPMGIDEGKKVAKDVTKSRNENDEHLDDILGRGMQRPPPVNSQYLPLPWQGRLGYACLNTYLRTANPPVFSSRTCRVSTILEHRHPLQHPDQPAHATKNRPDKSKPAKEELGQKFVQDLGLQNARDIAKMICWNDKYGIKFMRLSSDMFPFASHKEYGYKLAPFAFEILAKAGKLAGELGHRLTTHPGQFTQLGSPHQEVITSSVRDLEYHDEMLSLLKLPEQQDRDAVMIIHMGGTYGDKAETLDRFRENYAKLSTSIRQRLVLENDDVSWSVHDLLPICEELNIPLVLDFHHHNIVFDVDAGIREGTLDIMPLYDRIATTWTKKAITQKMHYSEPIASSVTSRERRKHSRRVKTLPPCPPTMDLMIEAKDKEQAVFELMRTFKIHGWDKINTVIPYKREDEYRQVLKGEKKTNHDEEAEVDAVPVSPDDFAMGGPENRVYWPEGQEDWLKPRKREKRVD